MNSRPRCNVYLISMARSTHPPFKLYARKRRCRSFEQKKARASFRAVVLLTLRVAGSEGFSGRRETKEAGGEGQNTANTASSIDIGNISARAPAAQVPSDREYRRYDIAGIDRVAFVNANAGRVNIFAACSTF